MTKSKKIFSVLISILICACALVLPFLGHAKVYADEVVSSNMHWRTLSTVPYSGTTVQNGLNLWSDGANLYLNFNYGLTDTPVSLVYDFNSNAWVEKVWTGILPGKYINDDPSVVVIGDYILCRDNDGNSYYLDVANSQWVNFSWTGYQYPQLYNFWFDGTNYFYSNGSTQYIVDMTTFTFTSITWTGPANFTSFNAREIYKIGNNFYLMKNVTSHNVYRLDTVNHVVLSDVYTSVGDGNVGSAPSYGVSYFIFNGITYYGYGNGIVYSLTADDTAFTITFTRNFDISVATSIGYYYKVFDDTLYHLQYGVLYSYGSDDAIYNDGYNAGYADGLSAGDYGNGYNAGYADGSDVGYSRGYNAGNANGYDLGYNTGNSDGYNRGYNVGYSAGNDTGSTNGYNAGYAVGYADGVSTSGGNSFVGLIGATIDAPIQALTGLLNFEILGVNLSAFVYGLFTITLVIMVIKYIKGGK